MSVSPSQMLSLSIFATLIMIIVSFFMLLSNREKRCMHILEFWVSYLAYFAISYYTQGMGPKIIALSMLGFVWRTRTILLILGDVARKDIFHKWYVPVTAGGFLLSLVLSFFNTSFEVFTAPASLSIALIGLHGNYVCWKTLTREKITALHCLFLLNTTLIFIHTFDYPFLRFNHEFTGAAFALVLATTVVMAIVLPGLTIHDLQVEKNAILQVVLNERNHQLERQSKMSALGEMTATLVHELNNPLTLLLTRNELLLRKLEKEQFDKECLVSGLTQMHNTIHRMMKITKSLQTFSRNADYEAPRKIKLQDLIDETLAFSSDRFLEGNVSLLVGKVPDFTLDCRSVQLSQVLINLLNNAFDAVQSLSTQWVRIDFEATLSSVRILVIDSGKGIPQEVSAKIMLPFFTTKEAGKGTGLGLSISQQIVEDHSGKLYFENNGLNTTFVVELPCALITA